MRVDDDLAVGVPAMALEIQDGRRVAAYQGPVGSGHRAAAVGQHRDLAWSRQVVGLQRVRVRIRREGARYEPPVQGHIFLFLSHQRLGRARKESQGYGSRDPWRHMLPHHSHLHSILPSRPRTA